MKSIIHIIRTVCRHYPLPGFDGWWWWWRGGTCRVTRCFLSLGESGNCVVNGARMHIVEKVTKHYMADLVGWMAWLVRCMTMDR